MIGPGNVTEQGLSGRHSQNPPPEANTLGLTLLGLVGAGLAYWIQFILAVRFGTVHATDIYFAAAGLPTLLTTVLQTGLMIAGVPVFVDSIARTNPAAKASGQGLLRILFIWVATFAVIGGLVACFAAAIFRWTAPGLANTPETVVRGAGILRILTMMLPIAVGNSILGSFIVAQRRIAVLFWGQFLCHGSAMLFVLLFPKELESIAVAFVLGQLMQLMFFVSKTTWRGGEHAPHTTDDLKEIVRLFLPWAIPALLYKAHPLVDRYFASYYKEGSVAVLSFALAIIQVAVLISSKAASWETYPLMAASRFDAKRFQIAIATGLQTVIRILVPMLLVLLILRTELVRLAYAHGMMDRTGASSVTLAVVCYSGAVIALALGNVVTFAHYSLKDTMVPAIVGVAGFASQILITLLLLNKLGYLASAVAYSISSIGTLIVLTLLLKRKMAGTGSRLLQFPLDIFVAACIAAIVLLVLRYILLPSAPASWIGLAIRTTLCAAGAMIVYVLVFRFRSRREMAK